MDYAALQARATLLASFEGWTDVSPAPDWPTLVNRGWFQYSWDAEMVIGTSTITTVANQVSYPLTGHWKRMLDVIYDSTGTPSGLLHSTEDFERQLRPDWRTQASGTPVRYTFSPFDTLSLVPPPVASSKTVSVRGFAQGTALGVGDTPPIPDALQEAIAIYAAYLQGKVYAQNASRQRLLDFLADYKTYVAEGLSYGALQAEGD